jgi:primosomal protein N' (replication factor Y) (superfamily II helicase)
MKRYAEVYIDIKSPGMDHPFDYIIPPDIEPFIKTGSVVLIPVNQRKEIGYVVGIKDKTPVKRQELKKIFGLADISPVFDDDMLKLALWMSSYYVYPLSGVLRLLLPPGRKSKKTIYGSASPSKYMTVIRLDEKFYDKFKDDRQWQRKKAQRRILQSLQKEINKEMERSLLLKRTKSSHDSLNRLLEAGLVKKYSKRQIRDYRYGQILEEESSPVILNHYQEKCVESVWTSAASGESRKFLIHGVTGSGKTEVYMDICKRIIDAGRKSLVLVPEISLTPQIFSRFEKMFGKRLAVYHSHMSDGERYDRWMEIHEGNVDLLIGTRSALFTPMKNTGVIIMDEEHDPSYKENSLVRYNTRDVASKLCEIKRIPLVMGSATPSISTRYMASDRKDYSILEMPIKAQNSKKVERKIVDLKKIDRSKEDEFITSALYRAMYEELEKDNKVIIFINRRGFSNFVVCTECGNIPRCPACDLPYNYHRDIGKLICHHCGREEKYTGVCRMCGKRSLFLAGSGIQRVEAKIRKRFNDVPVFRMDSDAISRKQSHYRIIKNFSAPGRSILVGTQMVAKGLDIPDVTLVGVINCDGMLSLPDYHMNERVYQLVTQVSGRAGRKEKPGRVIIQTYRPDSYVIRHLEDEDYQRFYMEEIKNRKELFYPPFSNLVNIIISGLDESIVVEEAKKMLDKIQKDIKINIVVLGPAPAPFYRINRFYRQHILLKTKEIDVLTEMLGQLMKKYRKSSDIKIIIDVDPAWIL